MKTLLIDMQSLGFSFSPGGKVLFRDLSLQVTEGEFLLIRGASGSGKSTLLRILCRLQSYRQGTILFHGKPIESYPPSLLRNRMLYTTQLPAMTDATVRDNLLFPFSFEANSGKKHPGEDELRKMLQDFYLDDVSPDQHATVLSVGQQQRVALMRALLQRPEVLLLDEPTSALDAQSATMVQRIIERLNQEQGMTIMMVTHSDYIPQGMAPKICTLENGKLEVT